MAVLTGEGIQGLVDLLCRRQVSLWHACQFVDFFSYLDLGGVPSRRLLEESGCRFTHFVTDGDDRVNGVWPRVFMNPEDHGWYFANGRGWTPNPYGPIQIQMKTSLLLDARDVAWTRRSAGEPDFNLNIECIDDLDLVDRLFAYSQSSYPIHNRAIIKSTRDISQAISYDRAGRPEINCEMSGEIAPMANWIAIWVDRCEIGGQRLKDLVSNELAKRRISIRTHLRSTTPQREHVMREMMQLVHDGVTRSGEMIRNPSISDITRVYLSGILSSGLSYQLDRWAAYLQGGTIEPLDT